MTALPPSSDATGSTVTEGQFKTWITNVRDYLSGLFGTDGTIATALATLGVLFGAGTPTVSATSTITAADRGKVYRASGTITLNLPTVASAGIGWSICVQNAGTGVITLDGASAETVDGATTAAIPRGRSAVVLCTGTAWVTMAMPGAAGGPVLMDLGTAAAPGLAVAGDDNTGIYSPGADQIGLTTGGTLRLSASTTAITAALPFLAASGNAAAPGITFAAGTQTGFFRAGSGIIGITTAGSEVARFSANRFAMGLTTPLDRFHIAGEGTDEDSRIRVDRASSDGTGARIQMRKARGTLASPTALSSGDRAGTLLYTGHDGSAYASMAEIAVAADAAHSAGSTPGRVIISTTPSGSTSMSERARIDAAGLKVTGRLEINSWAIGGTSVVIADDAVATLTPGRTGGFLFVTVGGGVGAAVTTEAACAFLRFDCGTTANSIEKGTGFSTIGALVNTSTSTLTGTTGTDTFLTVSARNDGTIQIENRLGTSATVNVGWL